MTSRYRRKAAPRWPWAVAILIAILIAVSAFGVWSGQCIDVAVDSAAQSVCTSAPAVGWPAAWVTLALCAAVVVISAVRLVRRRHLRRRTWQAS